MFDLLSHFAGIVIGLLTAVVALVTAWLKLRADRKPVTSPGTILSSRVMAQINQTLRTDPERAGYGGLKTAAIGGGLAGIGTFAALETAHAALTAVHAHAEMAATTANVVGNVADSCCSI